MTEARDVFVVQLARASRRANRYVRHLQKADREDVLAAAIEWCWENRESYSLTTTLDTWFVNAVRDAYKNWRRAEVKPDVPAPVPIDSTLGSAEALSTAESFDQAVINDQTVAEVAAETGLSERTIKRRRSQARETLPDPHEYPPVTRTEASVDVYEGVARRATIDKELEKLDFPPQHGKDCPPCWKCKWFEGYLPGARREVAMRAVDPEVSAAVKATEERKIDIATNIARR